MRLAFFSPLSPQRSGISDYSEDLLPFLAKEAEIDLFTEDGIFANNPAITSRFTVFSYKIFAERHQNAPYDLCLYQMGNNPKYHAYMDTLIREYPGVVTLHDVALQHFYVETLIKRNRKEEYAEAMKKYYGWIGEKIAYIFNCGFIHDYVFYQFPLYQRVVEPSLGTIVHSSYAKSKILGYNSSYRVEWINMGIALPNLVEYSKEVLRQKYGISQEKFVVGAFGYISPGKRIPELLSAFAAFAKDAPDALCLLVGHLVEPEELPGFDMRALIRELGIESQVMITGFTPYDQFFDYIALSDVCVNLRHPTVRATSANILKIMAFAKPVLISDLCECLDFPPTACIKVPLNEKEEEAMTDALQRLYCDGEYRKTLGQRARAYIETEHSLERAAEQYLAFCADIIASRSSSA
ncbi:glycosyl transferase group 1 [Candidatus Moduliflexus flocculans]|uniref:Glycosyl transferase group 1 n=1 Tax=Candidatus Moduliflexus flocculans TaxID=1499966 RepID=A0A0S6VT36_9BACT|nr:glycosyl transferase group 1 [Candidatus Moduliflexus flocculans]